MALGVSYYMKDISRRVRRSMGGGGQGRGCWLGGALLSGAMNLGQWMIVCLAAASVKFVCFPMVWLRCLGLCQGLSLPSPGSPSSPLASHLGCQAHSWVVWTASLLSAAPSWPCFGLLREGCMYLQKLDLEGTLRWTGGASTCSAGAGSCWNPGRLDPDLVSRTVKLFLFPQTRDLCKQTPSAAVGATGRNHSIHVTWASHFPHPPISQVG